MNLRFIFTIKHGCSRDAPVLLFMAKQNAPRKTRRRFHRSSFG